MREKNLQSPVKEGDSMKTVHNNEMEAVNCMMLFCALLWLKSSNTAWDQAMAVVPLDNRSRFLAENIRGFAA